MRAEFIDPGAFRTELRLMARNGGPDGMGGQLDGWTETATLFARLEPQRARSLFGAGQAIETVTHRVTMRFREGVLPGMRFQRATRKLDIVTVFDPDETGRYLVCEAREVNP